MSPPAAKDAGLGNGLGKGLNDVQIPRVNPDYIANIYIPETNIRIGSTYLAVRIKWVGGDLSRGLESYYNVGTAAGRNYAKKIMDCAAKVRTGDIKGGLETIYPSPK